MGLTVVCGLFLDIFHILHMFCGPDSSPRNILRYFPQSEECGKYLGIFRGLLSVPQNIVMDLNHVTRSDGMELLLLLLLLLILQRGTCSKENAFIVLQTS